MIISPSIPMIRAANAGQGDEGSGDNPDPPPTMIVRETGWSHIDLTWQYAGVGWENPCVMQRITSGSWPTIDFSATQNVETNYIFIGIREANRYVDNGLEPQTTYRYRVAYVTNWSDVVRSSATPTYSNWEYGLASTDSVTFTEYNAVDDFNADPTGATNSWSAFRNAFAAVRANGNACKLYAPAGTYLCYPTSGDVKFDGQYLHMVNGQSAETSFINGNMSNFILYGDTDVNGNPSTFFNMKLWHNRPGTEWLTILKSAGGDPGNDNDIYWNGVDPRGSVRRYMFWSVDNNTQNIQLKDVDIDMGATPVSTGIRFETLDDGRYRWDLSQAIMKSSVTTKNWYVKNVTTTNCRGENFFTGGFDHEKIKFVDCNFSATNSSITSFSANTEYENCTFSDFSNAAIESAAHSRDGDDTAAYIYSPFTGLQIWHDTIVRGCTFNCIDQSANGKFKDLADLGVVQSSFSGIHVFNQKETFCTITDTTVQNFRNSGFGPWYECFNSFVNNLTIESPRVNNAAFIYLNPRVFTLYLLSGGMDYCYWGNMTLDFNGLSLTQAGTIFTNYAGLPCQDNFTMDKVTVDGGGITHRTVWQDNYPYTGRENFQLRDWTFNNISNDGAGVNIYVNLSGGNMKFPRYVNHNTLYHHRVVNNADKNLNAFWGENQIENYQASTYDIDSFSSISQHREGSELKFKPFKSGDTITFKANASWNDFSQDYTITGTQVLTCKVVNIGTNKLEYVSLA